MYHRLLKKKGANCYARHIYSIVRSRPVSCIVSRHYFSWELSAPYKYCCFANKVCLCCVLCKTSVSSSVYTSAAKDLEHSTGAVRTNLHFHAWAPSRPSVKLGCGIIMDYTSNVVPWRRPVTQDKVTILAIATSLVASNDFVNQERYSRNPVVSLCRIESQSPRHWCRYFKLPRITGFAIFQYFWVYSRSWSKSLCLVGTGVMKIYHNRRCKRPSPSEAVNSLKIYRLCHTTPPT